MNQHHCLVLSLVFELFFNFVYNSPSNTFFKSPYFRAFILSDGSFLAIIERELSQINYANTVYVCHWYF